MNAFPIVSYFLKRQKISFCINFLKNPQERIILSPNNFFISILNFKNILRLYMKLRYKTCIFFRKFLKNRGLTFETSNADFCDQLNDFFHIYKKINSKSKTLRSYFEVLIIKIKMPKLRISSGIRHFEFKNLLETWIINIINYK